MSRYMSRAKSTEDDKWMYGYFCERGYGGCGTPCILPKYEDQHCFWKVDTATLGSCSGEKDTDSMYIYEDDIVEVPFLDPIFGDIVEGATTTGVIVFKQGCYCVDYHGDRIVTMHSLKGKLKVVGNIFDNPDLVEV